MKTRSAVSAVIVAALVLTLNFVWFTAPASAAGVFITEFCSNSGDNQLYEFVEITNLSAVPQNMVNWSEDDSTREVGKHSGHIFSDESYYGPGGGITTLGPGESMILTEAAPDAFRTPPCRPIQRASCAERHVSARGPGARSAAPHAAHPVGGTRGRPDVQQ